MNNKKIAMVLAVCLAACMLLTACQSGPAQQPSQDDNASQIEDQQTPENQQPEEQQPEENEDPETQPEEQPEEEQPKEEQQPESTGPVEHQLPDEPGVYLRMDKASYSLSADKEMYYSLYNTLGVEVKAIMYPALQRLNDAGEWEMMQCDHGFYQTEDPIEGRLEGRLVFEWYPYLEPGTYRVGFQLVESKWIAEEDAILFEELTITE